MVVRRRENFKDIGVQHLIRCCREMETEEDQMVANLKHESCKRVSLEWGSESLDGKG